MVRGFIGVKSNDGHDAPILYVAELLQRAGVEVIYGGFRLDADQFVRATIQEDVDFTGISSYNGGHVDFFRAVRDGLKQQGHKNIHLVGGGGATITPEDIALLEAEEGIDKIFGSGEGHSIGEYVMERYASRELPDNPSLLAVALSKGDLTMLPDLLRITEEKARLETIIAKEKRALDIGDPEALKTLLHKSIDGRLVGDMLACVRHYQDAFDSFLVPKQTHTFGFTGRGGSGKSTLIDELAYRFCTDSRYEQRKLAIIAIDPSTGKGAFLADRIRYAYATNSDWVDTDRVYIRSVASHGEGDGLSMALSDMLKVFSAAGYDVFVETYGTGQQDTGIVRYVERPVFVTTPDFGDEMQALKEGMLHEPNVLVALNKSDLDAGKALAILGSRVEQSRLFSTQAARHSDAGVDALYQKLTEGI